MHKRVEGYSDIILGSQWGDEGKARVSDGMAKDYDVIARFNGGANAGHTIDRGGQVIALNQVPSGVFYPDKLLYIGSGCMVNLPKLINEMSQLRNGGLEVSDRLRISAQAGVIQPHHILIDILAGKGVGTTKNGIGPAYADRAMRMWKNRILNIRIGDLLYSPDVYFSALKDNFMVASEAHDSGGIDIDTEITRMKNALDIIGPFVEMDPLFLANQVRKGAKVLFEGAQSVMLDVNKGSVPFVTSSNTIAAAAYIGGDLPVRYHRKIVGVAKAIMSRVGHGPFVSEFGGSQSEEYCMASKDDGLPQYGKKIEEAYPIESLLASDDSFEMGKAVRVLSGEYGTVTTRPRRVGALDLVQLTYAVQANGIDELVLTKTDLLNIYSRTQKGQIPIVKGYQLDDQRIDYVPSATDAHSKVKPIIEYRPAFKEDITGVKEFDRLPVELRTLVEEIGDTVGCKVTALGVGPERDQYIEIK